MRFAKRGKSPMPWGRPSRRDGDPEYRPVASDERSALLSRDNDGEVSDEQELEGRLSPSNEDTTSAEEGLPPAAPAYVPQGDPTQRLLTALGRFQRQIARAREGLPQESWGEECMRQLVSALEISISQGWKDVFRTLTETARILQSYLVAGEADRCVAFLADVYEILCLMVGDLIVGNVRSGVLEKWRVRHERALADLSNAGIELWTDDDEAAAAAADPGWSEAGDGPAPTTFPQRQHDSEPESARGSAASVAAPEWARPDDLEPFPFDLDEGPFPAESPRPASADLGPSAASTHEEQAPEPDELDVARSQLAELDRAVEELIGDLEGEPFGMSGASADAQGPLSIRHESELGEGAFAEDGSGGEDDPAALEESGAASYVDWGSAAPGIAPWLSEDEPAVKRAGDVDRAAPESDAGGLEDAATLDSIESENDIETPAEPDPARDGAGAAAPVLPQVVETMLDRFCERLERLSDEDAEAPPEAWAELGEILSSLEDFAQENGRDGALAPCLAMARMVRLATNRRIVPDKRFIDLAYAFSGLYAEAGPRANTPAIQAWLTECDDLLVSWAMVAQQPTAAEPKAAEAAKRTEPTETAERCAAANALRTLLETAQRAVSEGNAADAKLLALQAAAQIAEMQAEEAESRVEQAELRLKRGAAERDQMRVAVQHADQAVATAEEAAEEGRRELEETQAAAAATRGKLQEIDAAIRSLDEQIKALQAKRDDSEKRRRAAESELSQTEAQISEKRRMVESFRNGEREARVALEDARQSVTLAERKRVENETAMERARELLSRQRAALQEIKETIAQIRSADANQSEDDQNSQMLF